MVENIEEYMFTPRCFEKDFNKICRYTKSNTHKKKTLIKGSGTNRIFEVNKSNSLAYLVMVY